MNMLLSDTGVEVLHEFENCVLKAYPDPKTKGDPWTIGWGHTGPEVKKGLVWSQDKANEVFARDVAVFEKMANMCIMVPVTQGQFDAMVSILFNVGPGRKKRPGDEGKNGILQLKDGSPSTLLRKLNAGDYAGCAAEFPKWCSPGSPVEAGLKRRRIREQKLFLTGK